jgi:cytochrome c biogenesis protein ResB
MKQKPDSPDSPKILSSFLAVLSSPLVTVILLFLTALLVVYGTLYQIDHGIYEARQHIFNASFVLIAEVVPFPGVKLVIVLLFVNLLAAGAARVKRSWKNIGLGCVHLGIALLFVNAGTSYFHRQESSLTIHRAETADSASLDQGQKPESAGKLFSDPRKVVLPFSVRLNDFVVRHHPASAAVTDYESHVHVKGNGIDRDVVISMNRPFRFHDYTLYQSSYGADQSGDISTLAVVRNQGWMMPYVASCMIAAGLIIHFLIVFVFSVRKRHAA